MGRPRSFLGCGAVLAVFGGWALVVWYASDWRILLTLGLILLGTSALFALVGLYLRWQGWE